jgi:hypothetical protein
MSHLASRSKSSSQSIVLYVVLGVVFWFGAALLVRILGEAVFTPNNPLLIVMFVVAIPIGRLFIWVAQRLGKLGDDAVFAPAVMMTQVALLLDGIAITWFPQLYGESHTTVMLGAALIMWGAGIGLIIAWIMAKVAVDQD